MNIIKTFYFLGSIIFLIVAIFNTYSLVHFWPTMFIANKISSIAGIAFNILLVLFFTKLWNDQRKQEKLYSEQSLEQAFSNAVKTKQKKEEAKNKNGN